MKTTIMINSKRVLVFLSLCLIGLFCDTNAMVMAPAGPSLPKSSIMKNNPEATGEIDVGTNAIVDSTTIPPVHTSSPDLAGTTSLSKDSSTSTSPPGVETTGVRSTTIELEASSQQASLSTTSDEEGTTTAEAQATSDSEKTDELSGTTPSVTIVAALHTSSEVAESTTDQTTGLVFTDDPHTTETDPQSTEASSTGVDQSTGPESTTVAPTTEPDQSTETTEISSTTNELTPNYSTTSVEPTGSSTDETTPEPSTGTSDETTPEPSTHMPFFVNYHEHHFDKSQMIVTLRTNSKHDFVCKLLSNKTLEIVLDVDPCHPSVVELVGPSIDPSEPVAPGRHDCESASGDLEPRDHTEEIRFATVTCDHILPNSDYALIVYGHAPIPIPTDKEKLVCEYDSLKNQTDLSNFNLKMTCKPPVCTSCRLSLRFSSATFNETYECNTSDISINEMLPTPIKYCATNSLVAVLRDPLGLNTAIVWSYEWQVTPEFQDEDFDFFIDCALDPRQNEQGQSCQAFSALSLRAPVVRYALRNKWKNCRDASFSLNLSRDISCSTSPDPDFSVVHSCKGLFLDQLDNITDKIDKDNITFSSAYKFEALVTTLDQNNESRTMRVTKEKNSTIAFIVLTFDESSAPIDGEDSISFTYAKPKRTNTCSRFRINIREINGTGLQIFNVNNDAGSHNFTRLKPGTQYEIYPSTTIRTGVEHNGTNVKRFTNVSPITGFRVEPTQGTSFNLTFTFDRPAGNFKQLLLCYKNTETTKSEIDEDGALKKNTLKCNIDIKNNQSPFSYRFNTPSELEFGNSYNFVIRTVGCEENLNTLCQVDSDPRSFEMGPDAVLNNQSYPLGFNRQSNSIIVTAQRLPAQSYDNITIVCESTDPKKNSNSTGLCTENTDSLAQYMRCVCANLMPAVQYDISISVNRRNKKNTLIMPAVVWTAIEWPQDLAVEEETKNRIRVCWKYQYALDMNLDGFRIITKQMDTNEAVVGMTQVTCLANAANSSTCIQQTQEAKFRRICFVDSNLLPGTKYRIEVYSFYQQNNNSEQINASRSVLPKTNLDLPSNILVSSDDTEKLKITFVPPKSPQSITTFELCIYERDKNHRVSCRNMQYPNSQTKTRQLNSNIPAVDEETYLEFPLSRTKMNTEYSLRYWVTKPDFEVVDGEYCSYKKNDVCIAYKIPFPQWATILTSVLGSILVVGGVVGVFVAKRRRAHALIKETEIKPSKIGEMLNTKRHKDEWKRLEDLQEAYEKDHRKDLYPGNGSRFSRKNRYSNIVPYAKNRVRLEAAYDEEDYINASYVNRQGDDIHFIAAMGPLDTTKSDFWNMIWQQNVDKIIMLTKINEADSNQCAMYWTDIERVTEKFGSMQVKLKKINYYRCFIHREFELRTVKKIKRVHHYQFTEWPDMDDTDAHDMLQFIDFVKSEKAGKQEELWVVHCSAGVGRTGTFISIIQLYNNAAANKYLNLFVNVQQLRTFRVGMIQKQSQYRLVYQVLGLIYQKYNRPAEFTRVETPVQVEEQDFNSAPAPPPPPAPSRSAGRSTRNSRNHRTRSQSRRRREQYEMREVNET